MPSPPQTGLQDRSTTSQESQRCLLMYMIFCTNLRKLTSAMEENSTIHNLHPIQKLCALECSQSKGTMHPTSRQSLIPYDFETIKISGRSKTQVRRNQGRHPVEQKATNQYTSASQINENLNVIEYRGGSVCLTIGITKKKGPAHYESCPVRGSVSW